MFFWLQGSVLRFPEVLHAWLPVCRIKTSNLKAEAWFVQTETEETIFTEVSANILPWNKLLLFKIRQTSQNHIKKPSNVTCVHADVKECNLEINYALFQI